MNELSELPNVELTPAAAAALRARGGNLYIWTVGAGIPCARTNPARDATTYTTIRFDEGCYVHIDSSLDTSRRWVIKWRRLPWPRFKAVYGPVDLGLYKPDVVDLIDGLTRL